MWGDASVYSQHFVNVQMCSEQVEDSIGCINYSRRIAETIGGMYGRFSKEYLFSIDDIISKYKGYGLDGREDLLDLLYEKLSIIDTLGMNGKRQDVCLDITLNAVYRSRQLPYSDAKRTVLNRAVNAVSGLPVADTLKKRMRDVLYVYIDDSCYKESKIRDSEGNYETAISLMEQSLVLRERLSGKNSIDYAISLGEIATYYGNSGEYLKAIELLQEALHKMYAVAGEKDINYLSGLNNLAIQYSNIGNYGRAIDIMGKMLPLRESVSGINDDYVRGLSNLALYFSKSGNQEEAIKTGEEAVERARQIYGAADSKYAVCLHNLAIYCTNAARLTEAMELMEDALAIFRKSGKSDTPDNYTILAGLALCNYISVIMTKP